MVGRGALPSGDPAERARDALGGGRGRGVAPRADGEEPVCRRIGGRGSTRRRPVRRVESGHPRRRRTGLSDAAEAVKPASPRYHRGAGEGLRPFDPQQTRAPADGAGQACDSSNWWQSNSWPVWPTRASRTAIRNRSTTETPRGSLGKPLAAASFGCFRLSNILERYRTIGDYPRVDFLANGPSPFGDGDAGTPVQRADQGAPRAGWRTRVAPPLATDGRTRIRQPVAPSRRGKWPISHSLARLADTVFGLTCMEIVTKQFEVSPRSVPRCRFVPRPSGSPSREGSEEGNRR